MRISKTPMGTLVFIIGVCTLSLLILHACRKLEPDRHPIQATGESSIAKFFQIPAGTHQGVIRIAQEIKRQNSKENFVENFIKKQGYLLWDKAKVFRIPPEAQARLGGGGDTSYIIPLVLENTHRVNGFVAALPKGGDSILFRLYDATTYKSHYNDTDSAGIEARELALICMLFEENIFGHRVYKISDTSLFRLDNKPVGYLKLEQTPLSRLVALGSWYFCYSVWVTNDNGQVVGCPPGDPNCNAGQSEEICENVTIYGFDDMYGEIPGGGGGGSQGGGESGWYNPCREIDTIPGTSAGNACTSGGPLGWIYYTPLDVNAYDPYSADTVAIASGLKDSYPCIAKLIKDSIMNGNLIAQITGANIFNENVYMNLTFDTSTLYTTGAQGGGHTNVPATFSIVNGSITKISLTIYLNGWHLRNATHEYNIGTIIHECMHAIFVARRMQYVTWLNTGQGAIDSAYMKAHFPLHWYYMTNQEWPPNMEEQHLMMGTDWLNLWNEVMTPYYNPNAPTSVRDSMVHVLGYLNLLETSGWRKLPSQGVDTCDVKAYEQVMINRIAGGTFGFSQGCVGKSYTIHYKDSAHLRDPCN